MLQVLRPPIAGVKTCCCRYQADGPIWHVVCCFAGVHADLLLLEPMDPPDMLLLVSRPAVAGAKPIDPPDMLLQVSRLAVAGVKPMDSPDMLCAVLQVSRWWEGWRWCLWSLQWQWAWRLWLCLCGEAGRSPDESDTVSALGEASNWESRSRTWWRRCQASTGRSATTDVCPSSQNQREQLHHRISENQREQFLYRITENNIVTQSPRWASSQNHRERYVTESARTASSTESPRTASSTESPRTASSQNHWKELLYIITETSLVTESPRSASLQYHREQLRSQNHQ